MNKTIKLSLVAFMLLSANVVYAETALTNGIEVLANATETINSNKTILSDTYTTPTDITHTGGTISFGKKGELHSIGDININSNSTSAKYWIYGDVYLNNTSFQKPNGGNTVHSLIIDNGSNLTMVGGRLSNIAINLATKDLSYQDSVILDNVRLDNVKYGYNTEKSANFTILNSNVNNSDFKHETIFMTSTLNGDITGGSLIIQENSKILGNIQASNLNISNSIVDGTTNNSLDVSNNIILDNTTINGTNVTLKDNASISIENNSVVNSEIVFGKNNSLTIDNANYEIKKDLDLANLKLTNHTIQGAIDKKLSISASNGMQFNNTNIENVALNLNPGDKKYIQFIGENNLKNVSIKNTNPLDLSRHHITINTNDTILTIENSEIENSSINTWTAQLKDSKLIVKDSKLINTGIGNVQSNNGMYARVPYVEFVNVEYVNDIAGNGIFVKDLVVNGGHIKTDKIYGANTKDFGTHGEATRDGTSVIAKNGAVIESNVDVEKFEIENSTLTGNIEVIKDAVITNTQIKSDTISANDLIINNQTSSFNANNINIVNGLGINNSSNIQGNFKVGNDFHINNSTILGNIEEVKNLSLTNSTLTGDINATSNNLNLTNSNIITDKLVSVSNDITITNTDKQTINTNFSAGNNFTSTNTEFSGNITANSLLSDENSTFKGEVTANSIKAVGSIFEQTLTITGNSKNNILDNATLMQGINVDSKEASISIVNGSNIQGAINNEGTITVDKNSTISNKVNGSGKLNTDSTTYNENVSMGSIEGSGNTFIKDVEVTNKDSILNIGDNTFGGNIKVENGTIMADSSFNLKDLTASNINIKNEDANTKDKISTNNVSVSDKLFIENIDIKANQISAKEAEISNSNVTSTVFLKGNNDTATSVYDKATITSGNYTIENSAIKGGIRVNELKVSNSKIIGQLAVNTLNASNSTFYITGGGYNTSLYQHFSGAIVAKEGASGFGNTINISNTNLGKLVNGYVPIAIINNKIPDATRADVIAASPRIVNEDFFKVTYTTSLSTIFLSPSIVHYNKIDTSEGIKEIWSVGLAGKELNEDEVMNIISGKGNADYSTTQAVDKNYKDYIMSEVFDDATKDELDSIIYNPYFVAKQTADILNDRFTYLRTSSKNHGFWVDNNYSYNLFKNTKLRNKSTSLGIDRNIELDNLSVSYGVFTDFSRLSLDSSTSAKVNTKAVGVYASANFYNGTFVDYSLAYASLKNKIDANKIGFNNTYYTNLWQANIGVGHRLGNENYIEPNIKLSATKLQKHTIKTDKVEITANQGALVSLNAGVKAGVSFNKNFSLNTELAYYNDLNKTPKAKVVSMLDNEIDGIRDYGINAKLGLTVKPNDKLDINASFTKQISLIKDSGYKANLGFTYKF